MTAQEIKLELNKFALAQAQHDETIRHNAVSEEHTTMQKYVWVGTVILLALGIIFK